MSERLQYEEFDYKAERARFEAFGAACSRVMGRLFLLLFLVAGIGIVLLSLPSTPLGWPGIFVAMWVAWMLFGPDQTS